MSQDPILYAKSLYNIEHWSDGFFDIDSQGMLVALPHRQKTKHPISLDKLAKDIVASGLTLPVLVRFNSILRQRVADLHDAFGKAIAEHHYQNKYYPVYPIKVNQQRRVVMEFLQANANGVGLEAGSKPELMAVLALSQKPNSLIICNGYKDREYIRLALIGRKLGHQIFIIVEKSSEIDLILEEAKNLNVEPLIGIRVRLAAMASGKWQNTGGERGKFGLSARQVLEVIERLKTQNFLKYLQLLHFHMGSQVANIRDIQKVMHECGRYYIELRKLGADIQWVDVGGGLGVDYEGTRSRSACSINYNIQEYANNIVYALGEICRTQNQPYPKIITESGRAMSAHHAVLITDIIDREIMTEMSHQVVLTQEDAQILHDLMESYKNLDKRSVTEVYHDAVYWIGEAQSMYNHGLLSLSERAKAEQIYLEICIKVRDILQVQTQTNQTNIAILNELNEKLADKYFCNFSLFQSIPDSWAINQIFPVMPLSHLNSKIERRGTLHDLTCDSDGQIKKYVDGQGIETTLPLPKMSVQDPYFIGIFLVGAYQEILGDIHNLFGDTNSVHVEIFDDGSYKLMHPTQGDSVTDVLRYVNFNADELLRSYQAQLQKADITDLERQNFFEELTSGLGGYTYLEE